MPLPSRPLPSAMDIDTDIDAGNDASMPQPATSTSATTAPPSNPAVPSNIVTSRFPGLVKLVGTEYPKLGVDLGEEARDDLEAEQETLPDLVPEDEDEDSDDEDDDDEEKEDSRPSTSHIPITPIHDPVSHANKALPKYKDVVKEYSKGVKSETVQSYEALMKQLVKFLVEHAFIEPGDTFFTSTPHEDAAYMIVAWIMHDCDAINLDGTVKDDKEYRRTFSHAQKMRAAATFGFGRMHDLGNTPWHRSEVTGKMVGNPSVSQQVSLYMVSLRRRKVQAGENDATSARAVTVDILRKLYDYNVHPDRYTIKPLKQVPHSEKNTWGGAKFRRLMHLAYCVAFCCLLRVDEVLHIQFHEIEVVDVPVGKDGLKTVKMLKVTLPFRKTNQFGKIQPFYLKMMPENLRFMCPYRAYAQWVNVCRETDGYVFRKVSKADRISKANKPMTSQKFLESFRQNLLDIDIDPAPYGTHSFRRGGTQWLHIHRRWPLKMICEWGGWSTDFSNGTIMKYLHSWNDNPMMPREHFFDLDQEPTVKCTLCGRSCNCWGR